MRRPLVAGNWKMNGSQESIKKLLGDLKAGAAAVNVAEMALCAPAIYISDTQSQLQGSAIAWGGQDLSTETSGAYTGEIAASMLLDFGCKYVIIGHSERRAYHGEGDQLVAKKYATARAAGLLPILCVGETLEEREQGITEEVVARQLDAVIELEGVAALADGVVAYEPVWAIGTGMTATPEQAQDVHAFIRSRVAAKDSVVAEGLRILYGGSMKPGNAQELIAKPDIDGGLIGGAALNAEDFLAICSAAN
ncbi:MAG: triose-phosphate isomerase [Sedimenticola sp.]